MECKRRLGLMVRHAKKTFRDGRATTHCRRAWFPNIPPSKLSGCEAKCMAIVFIIEKQIDSVMGEWRRWEATWNLCDCLWLKDAAAEWIIRYLFALENEKAGWKVCNWRVSTRNGPRNEIVVIVKNSFVYISIQSTLHSWLNYSWKKRCCCALEDKWCKLRERERCLAFCGWGFGWTNHV